MCVAIGGGWSVINAVYLGDGKFVTNGRIFLSTEDRPDRTSRELVAFVSRDDTRHDKHQRCRARRCRRDQDRRCRRRGRRYCRLPSPRAHPRDSLQSVAPRRSTVPVARVCAVRSRSYAQ